MARISYVNGRYIDHQRAVVHIEDRGYQFADGVYEYIAFYSHMPLDMEPHINRLMRSLDELEIAMPVAKEALPVIIGELISRNRRDDGGIYIQITRGVARRDHAFPSVNVRPSLVITICGAKTPKPQDFTNGVEVITHNDNRWGRCDIKSVSLLANVLAKQEAVSNKVKEVILVDKNGFVTEGAASNVFIVTKSGDIVTHQADESILSGITRGVVVDIANSMGITVLERSFSIKELVEASEVFITSTSINVLPVVKIGDKVIGNGKVGELTNKLQMLYNSHIYEQTGKKF
ncbi:MAG: D-amino-acid transaminase [Rickettsiales bacterium]